VSATDHGPDPEESEPTVRLPGALGTEPADRPTASGTEPTASSEPPGALRYAPAAGEPGAARARRFWSSRRVPSAITAAVALGLSGLFLYDVAAVRADRGAMAWRRTLADELATRHLDNVWVIVGAAVAAALGLWLIVLAGTPGERGVLPMTRRTPRGVRAGLDRHAAELVLRDRAMEVAGVRWTRVAVGRRRIRARASSHFRDIDDVRRDLTAALGEAVGQLGLARTPNLRVHVQPAEKKA
jgi:Family of unknown function (DUF6286)